MKLAVARRSERLDTAYSPRVHEEEPSAAANLLALLLAVERKSERADTAYSPRFREEELPATDNLLLTSASRQRRAKWPLRFARGQLSRDADDLFLRC